MERGGWLPTQLIARQSCRGTWMHGRQLRAADEPRAVAGQLRAGWMPATGLWGSR